MAQNRVSRYSSSSAMKRSVSGFEEPTFSIVTGLSFQACNRSRIRSFGPTSEISSHSSARHGRDGFVPAPAKEQFLDPFGLFAPKPMRVT